MKKLILCSWLLAILLTGCRALPERNYVGMTREQVIAAVAETPKVNWEKNSQFRVSVSTAPYDRSANANLYFKTLDELKKDPRVRDAKRLGVYYQSHWSGFTFYHELTLKDDLVVSQRIVGYSDGITLLPSCIFYDYSGERKIEKALFPKKAGTLNCACNRERGSEKNHSASSRWFVADAGSDARF